MRDYFYSKFSKQLESLEFTKPNKIVTEKIMKDNLVTFFGGKDWNNVLDDLSQIHNDERPFFILSLFMIVLTDQCLYQYQPDCYSTWRSKTNFPKFGWAGFGPHNENPFNILWAPERENLVDINTIVNLMPVFVSFLLEETKKIIRDDLTNIDFTEYFKSIRQDNAYTFKKGEIVKSFKSEFENQMPQ